MKQCGVGYEAAAGAGMKKDELAAFAAGKLAGLGWLPEPLQAGVCT